MKVANFWALIKQNKNLFSQKIVSYALCQHFLKARAPDQGLEPFLSPSKIAKRLEPSSPEPRIRSTTRCLPSGKAKDQNFADFHKGIKSTPVIQVMAIFLITRVTIDTGGAT
jgi:hypothetical protein